MEPVHSNFWRLGLNAFGNTDADREFQFFVPLSLMGMHIQDDKEKISSDNFVVLYVLPY